MISIIVLNWRNPIETLACLESLAQIDYLNAQITVIDNGSDDDSVQLIRQHFPEVEVFETGENQGYAGGNNAGIRHALAAGVEAICILNNDVTVDPGFLTPLLAALQEEPEAGVVTPLVAEQIENGDQVWALGSSVNWRTAAVTRNHADEPTQRWRNRPPFEVDVASGAAMLVKRDVFARVGLMDEAFFLYYEEVDWSLIVRQAGYRIVAVPSSVVWHKVSASLGTISPIIDYYMLRNHLYLIDRHWSGVRRVYLQGRVVLRSLIAIVAFTVRSHDGQRIPNRNARLLALRDAMKRRRGKMGPDVARVCNPNR